MAAYQHFDYQTDTFTIWEPQNTGIDVSEVHKKSLISWFWGSEIVKRPVRLVVINVKEDSHRKDTKESQEL